MTISDDRTVAVLPIRFLRRTAYILVALALVGVVLTAAVTLFQCLGQHWKISDRLRHADAAVVLGGGYETRPAAAAELYNAGTVKYILVSTAGVMANDDLNINRQALLKLGVPPAAIFEFGKKPSDTYQEACALAAWAERNHIGRIIVPTETFPSRRVRWILRRELGKVGVDARVETLTSKFYDSEQWWRSKTGIEDFSIEVVKYLYYRIRYWRS